jgi:hypothetical protein
MIYLYAIEHFIKNLKACLSYGILLVFVFLFLLLPNTQVSAGTMIFDYSLAANPLILVLEAILLLAFIMFYSIFTTLVIFGVRKEMSAVKISYYLREMLQRFAWQVFGFYALLSFSFILIALVGIQLGILIHPILFFAANGLMFVIALSLIFVPQAIVIDETDVAQGLANNFAFIKKNPGAFILVFFTGAILLGLVPLLEYAADTFFYAGRFVALVVTLLLIVPFLEIIKSHEYMERFELVKSTHRLKEIEKNQN